MPTLYITEPGATVRFSTGSIVVTVSKDPDGRGPLPTKTRQLIEVEPHRLELIALVGRIHITSHATRFCLENKIPVAWFKRNGDFLGRLVPELSRTADLRMRQYVAATDPERAVGLAREFVLGKIHNSIAVLSALRSNRPNHPELGSAIARLNLLQEQIVGAADLDSLLGYEGAGARTYFRGLQAGFDGGLRFAGRARRPPPDPVNALLSFGYVILTNSLASMIEARNLDPYVGFLHQRRSGRPSLALDILEELRPAIVDRFVLRLCNRSQMRMEHFEDDQKRGGIRLTRNGLRRFFREWEAFMDRRLPGLKSEEAVEVLLQHQINRCAAHLRGHREYRSLRLGEAYTV
ncbi:MAG: CRISPR-associated endonuclease Cas1 [Bacteroidota bacterium]|nr:CRISPR-associated endonuclease Cas1 [Bacteroidota bacterium]MDE2833666.1 CRISPR-associated endonuclease Cas1 [Bacteroidota bacterium]